MKLIKFILSMLLCGKTHSVAFEEIKPMNTKTVGKRAYNSFNDWVECLPDNKDTTIY